MRIIVVFLVLAGFHLNAENTPTVALTAGSEFSPSVLVEGQSITESFTVYTDEKQKVHYWNEPALRERSTTPAAVTSNGGSKEKTILLAALLVGIALFYITKKNKARVQEMPLTEPAAVNFENDEIPDIKKEMWNYLATPDADIEEEAEQDIIVTGAIKYSDHIYDCKEGKLKIRQAYQHPNVGETVYLNDYFAPDGIYKIGLLSGVEVLDGKVIKVNS
jgi:hypothetical protein